MESLRAGLQGSFLNRGDTEYASACRLYNLRFGGTPLCVVRPQVEADVSLAMQWAIQRGIPWTVKSGGHSYIGASVTSGLLIDLSALGRVEPIAGGRYRIGPGAPLQRVYARLACDGLSIPAGTCDTVGFGGLALGGGVGYLMREHGLTIDRIRAMRVVLADGSVVTASADSEPDLFWALRGCGGGNFGVVTSFDVEPVSRRSLQHLGWRWAWSDGEAAFLHWQQVLAQGALPRHAVTYMSFRLESGAASPVLVAGVISSGSFTELESAADLFIGPSGVRNAGSTSWWVLPHPVCDSTETASVSRYKAKSAMLFKPMSVEGVRGIQRQLEARRLDPAIPVDNQASVTFLSLGGAVADVSPDATSFPHREALADVQYLAYWPGPETDVAQANLRWMRRTYDDTFPWISGGGAGCYVNYCDDELDAQSWPGLYYGANLPRLRALKSRYDPHDVFRGPQSIRA